jgi:hypothetical protein
MTRQRKHTRPIQKAGEREEKRGEEKIEVRRREKKRIGESFKPLIH